MIAANLFTEHEVAEPMPKAAIDVALQRAKEQLDDALPGRLTATECAVLKNHIRDVFSQHFTAVRLNAPGAAAEHALIKLWDQLFGDGVTEETDEECK